MTIVSIILRGEHGTVEAASVFSLADLKDAGVEGPVGALGDYRMLAGILMVATALMLIALT